MSEKEYYDNVKDMSKNDDGKKKPVIVFEGITYITCPIHKITFPKGASCYKCDNEKNKKT